MASLNASMNTLATRINDVTTELAQLNDNTRNAGNELVQINTGLNSIGGVFGTDGAIGAVIGLCGITTAYL